MKQVAAELCWLLGEAGDPEVPLTTIEGSGERSLKMPKLARLQDPNTPLKMGVGDRSLYFLPCGWHKKLVTNLACTVCSIICNFCPYLNFCTIGCWLRNNKQKYCHDTFPVVVLTGILMPERAWARGQGDLGLNPGLLIDFVVGGLVINLPQPVYL